jgi:hypothetical protein
MEVKTSAKEKHALVLLIGQILDQLDEVASLRRAGHSAKLSSSLLKEMCSVLSELPAELQTAYQNALLLITEKRAHFNKTYDEKFAEYSVQAKRRLISNIREELKLSVANEE